MTNSAQQGAPNLELDPETRSKVWERVIENIENYTRTIADHRVTPELAPQKIRTLLAACDFEKPMDALEAIDFVCKGLTEYQTHTPHPRYYGLFNPAPTTMGIAADALVAAFNPQIAAWSHSPLAAEIEQHLIRAFGQWFGYDPKHTDGTFASGGAEANHTALLTALTDAFPDYPNRGLRALEQQPVFYVSSESHYSFLKAARITGIGLDAVRKIEVDRGLRMNPQALETAIAHDRGAGLAPFLVVATAGTTNAGVIDPLAKIAKIAAREGLWYHVDAAWGGAAVLVPELRPLLDGIAAADSITFDAHKWLSVPMGAGIYLTRQMEILHRTFRTPTAYMPREAAGLDVIDPHLHSMQWSRRFIGLKVFLSLLVAGRAGYEEVIRRQTALGDLLRDKLRTAGWTIQNDTPLPVVCFADPGSADPQDIVMRIVSSGQAWISTTQVNGRPVLRACITNYRTEPGDIDALLHSLNEARGQVSSTAASQKKAVTS